MTDDTDAPETERETRRRRGPIGTVLGATLGPFGAAIGTVIDEDRVALTFSLGTGAGSGDENGGTTLASDATTIEIEDAHEADDAVDGERPDDSDA